MLEIRLLKEGYKNNNQVYEDFISEKIDLTADYFSEKTIFINEAPDFPFYIANGSEEEKGIAFFEAISTIKQSYIQTDRSIHLNEVFWHSLLITKKREYALEHYPKIMNGKSEFDNVVFKKFDWENYIYKCVLAAEYIHDANFDSEEEEQRYIKLIAANLDVYNYLIKYSIFRNSQFVMNFLTILGEDEDLSNVLKLKIKHRPDLGKDERYGRRVIFELNKNYPVVMAPFLEIDDLKKEIYTALSLYLENKNELVLS
ncbi:MULTISPECIES: DUF6339 family protein [Enterococcus]|uniref:DUF6339 family protein n=1 Tax=Enterococcus dongliensis TaxID=2559925 RepID=A0ABU3ES02_9ENTE|nr:DUF6339 family protein [Enterococcus dongliensis]MDT2597643.1 DUF6339 family protein [Enterococcus dongliensis]